MAAYILPGFPVRSPHSGARCKLPFALRPGLSQEENLCTKAITKESDIAIAAGSYSSSADAMKSGVGRKSGRSSPAPYPPAAPSSSASASASGSSSHSLRSLRSHSDV